jgi:hypothetical protein
VAVLATGPVASSNVEEDVVCQKIFDRKFLTKVALSLMGNGALPFVVVMITLYSFRFIVQQPGPSDEGTREMNSPSLFFNKLQSQKGLTMPRLRVCALTMLLILASTKSGVAQVDRTRSSAPRDSMMSDQTLGVSFLRVGQVARHDENGYKMSLQSPGGKIRLATAGISVSVRRVVDLPGSYGGKMYLDELKAKSFLKNRVKVDTVDIGGLQFRREFWAVYAGMGAWEGVINCYAYHNRQYYVLSLNADVTLGRPGEVVDGERISAELLRTRLANILNDRQEPVIQKFNAFLSSFQVSE